MDKDAIAQLIAYGYKWFHVPNLENNNQWVKDALVDYFKQQVKVSLSEKTTEKKVSYHREDLQKVWNTERN